MIGVEVLTRRVGELAWVAAQLFELEGRWAEEMVDDVAVIHLATHSRHHGWHAHLWNEALPDSPALDAAARVVPPHGWSSAIELVGELGPERYAERLVSLYRHLVPRAVAMTSELGGSLTGPGDAAVARRANFVVADQTADLVGGLQLLASALTDTASIGRATTVSGRLDGCFVGSSD